MHTRTTRRLLRISCAPALVAFALLAGPSVGAHAQKLVAEPDALFDPRSAVEQVGIEPVLGTELPLDRVFLDEAGEPVTLGALASRRPLVVALLYFRCPSLCAEVMNGVLRTLRASPMRLGEDFDFVGISIDPSDTPAAAGERERLAIKSLDGEDPATAAEGWHFLTGSDADIQDVAAALGFRYVYYPREDQYAHASGVFVVSPAGRVTHALYGIEFEPRDLRLALVESASGTLGSLADRVLLLCFQYDPTTGRYGVAILTVIRLLGGLTVGAIVLFMVRNLVRERRARGRQHAEASARA